MVARRVFDEAKEAAKEAAKRASLASSNASFGFRRARGEEDFDKGKRSTSIVNGDVICCGRPNCQGTQKYTGASWTQQFAKRKQIRCTSCGKKLEASKWVVVAA